MVLAPCGLFGWGEWYLGVFVFALIVFVGYSGGETVSLSLGLLWKVESSSSSSGASNRTRSF